MRRLKRFSGGTLLPNALEVKPVSKENIGAQRPAIEIGPLYGCLITRNTSVASEPASSRNFRDAPQVNFL